jgi:hypothetical protein
MFTKTGLFWNISNRSFVFKEKGLSGHKPSDNQLIPLLEENQGQLPLWSSRALVGFVKAKLPVVCKGGGGGGEEKCLVCQVFIQSRVLPWLLPSSQNLHQHEQLGTDCTAVNQICSGSHRQPDGIVRTNFFPLLKHQSYSQWN